MLPTGRLLLLALATLVPFALSEWVMGLGVLTPVLVVGLVVLLGVDLRQTAAPERLVVAREIAERLSLGVTNPVAVVVANRGPRAVRFQARDEYPNEFAGSATILSAAAQSGETVRLRYEVTPPRRGDYGFGRVVVRYRSALGLF